MMSYGARISNLKLDVMKYIREKVEKEGAFRNEPGDLYISSASGCCFVKADNLPDMKLEQCSVERLCNIADKIHFRPLGSLIKEGSNGRATLHPPMESSITNQTLDMNFEIKSNIPLPGQVFNSAQKVEKKNSKQINYRALPLKDMKVGDCIILHECSADNISNKYNSAKLCIEKFVSIMDTKKKFKVAKTSDLKVGVWRIE